MRAWRVAELGEPKEAMRLVDVDDPQPGAGQLVVRVLAVAGELPGRADVPRDLPGQAGSAVHARASSCAARSVALGDGVTGFAVGDRVLGGAVLPYGGFGELALMDAATTFPAPEALDDARGAVLSTSATRPAGSACTAGRHSSRARPCSCTPPPAVSAAPRSSSARPPARG